MFHETVTSHPHTHELYCRVFIFNNGSLSKVLETHTTLISLKTGGGFTQLPKMTLLQKAGLLEYHSIGLGHLILYQVGCIFICGRQKNGSLNTATFESLEPVNILPYMARGTLQIRLSLRILGWKEYPTFPR